MNRVLILQACILWSYSASNDSRDEQYQYNMPYNIGRIITAIEMSLLRWETSQKVSIDLLDTSSQIAPSLSQSEVISSFHDTNDNDISRSLDFAAPYFQDLHIQPSSLCKVAWGVAKLASDNPSFEKSCQEIVRVSSKVFSFDNGKLLDYVSPKDVVRLCWAYVTVRCKGSKRITTSVWIRRLVDLINESTSFLDPLNSKEMSTLVWSLAEAGVKTRASINSKKSLLISIDLTSIDISHLDCSTLIKLVSL